MDKKKYFYDVKIECATVKQKWFIGQKINLNDKLRNKMYNIEQKKRDDCTINFSVYDYNIIPLLSFERFAGVLADDIGGNMKITIDCFSHADFIENFIYFQLMALQEYIDGKITLEKEDNVISIIMPISKNAALPVFVFMDWELIESQMESKPSINDVSTDLKEFKKINCPSCGKELEKIQYRQIDTAGVSCFWCDKCLIDIEIKDSKLFK
jgi:hypothetical protein